jgi:hypothetical protein
MTPSPGTLDRPHRTGRMVRRLMATWSALTKSKQSNCIVAGLCFSAAAIQFKKSTPVVVPVMPDLFTCRSVGVSPLTSLLLVFVLPVIPGFWFVVSIVLACRRRTTVSLVALDSKGSFD